MATLRQDNPHLEAFDIHRKGDEIILIAVAEVDGREATFRLVWERHDFYRLAMGAQLEEALAALTSADPKVEPAGATKQGSNVVLRLRHLQPPGARAELPQPAPTTVSSHPPLLAEAEVAVQDPGAPPPLAGARKVTESAAAGQPSQPPRREVATSPVAEAEEAYHEATADGSLQALKRFLARHPDAPQAAAARLRAEKLTEEAAFRQALARNDAEGYRAFLDHFPRSDRSGEAVTRLVAVEERRRAAEAERRREDLYAETRRLDTPAAYRVFLKAYPNSPEAADARRHLKTREAEVQASQRKRTSQAAPGPPAPVLRAPRVASAPAVDGQADDPAWRDAAPEQIPLTGGGPERSLQVRAVHDGSSLYLLAEWQEESCDTASRPWIWEPSGKTYRQSDQLDDGLAVALYLSNPPDAACMLQGQAHVADMWIWRAHWSEISGLADDVRVHVAEARMPQANPHPTRVGSGQVWVRRQPDAGVPGWSFFVPVEFQGETVPGYRAASPQGSRADVQARGRCSAGSWGAAWTVELGRALDTGHADDLALTAPGSARIAFAVYDRSEKGDHRPSPLVSLELQAQ